MNPHTPTATPILGDGVPVDSQNFRERFQGSNSMPYGVFYIIRKLLEHRCLKWARIAHLDIWNTSYSQKKGWKSNCQFDSRPEKSQESTQFTCLQMACNIPLESSWRGLQLFFRPHLDPRSARKVMGLKSCGSPNLGDSGLSFGSPETKSHLDVGPMERCRVYYKGEGGGFPQVRAVVSLVCSCCSWFVLAPKVLQLRTNHLAWVLCRFVWVSEACQLFLIPSQSSSTPLYPSKCCELKNVPRLLFLSLFFTWTHIWVFQGVRSASSSVR